MGAWGIGNFDNDTAADWALEFENSEDLTLVKEIIEQVLNGDEEYLDADLACEALAAIEVVARLGGNWGEKSAYSEPVDNWVEEHNLAVSPDLIADCIKTIDRILGKNSELNELWKESEDYEAWKGRLEDLKNRVSPGKPKK